MNRSGYVTGFLPEITTRKAQNIKIIKRTVVVVCMVTSVIFLQDFLMDNSYVDAQDLSYISSSSSSSSSIPTHKMKLEDKPIWLSINLSDKLPPMLASNTEEVNRTNSTVNSPLENLEILYQKDLEQLLNKVFIK